MKPNKIFHGDCLDVMREMEENSIDAVICDPPYELTSITKRFGKNGSAPAKHGTDGRYARLSKGFMGKTWDGTGIGMPPEVWRLCARVAKPGAYLLAFGGTRTFHRLACAIEDAGWIMRDSMVWLYGSGFPKSHDISKALDHKAGAEQEVVGEYEWPDGKKRHPENHAEFTGCPPEHTRGAGQNRNLTAPATPEAKQWDGFGTALKPAWEPVLLFQKPIEGACSEELHAITKWKRWHTKTPKESWSGESKNEQAWHSSKCYKLSKQYGLEWWEHETEDGEIERWIFERRWDALEPKARDRHVIIGKNKRVVLSRKKYKSKQYISGAANVIKWGCGALNIDGCRIGTSKNVPASPSDTGHFGSNKMALWNRSGMDPHQGRWPANALLSHTVFCAKIGEREVKAPDKNTWDGGASYFDGAGHQKGKGYTRGGGGKEIIEDWRCVSGCPIRILDEQSGELKSGRLGPDHIDRGKDEGTFGAYSGRKIDREFGNDAGGASRFFYCAKASKEERNAGLEEVNTLFERRPGFQEKGKAWNGYSEENSSEFERGSLTLEDRFTALPQANIHPTVKPIELLRYLCRLVTPPGGTVLDPFVGSGSMGCAAVLEGFQIFGIDKEKEYVEIAEARIQHWAAMAEQKRRRYVYSKS